MRVCFCIDEVGINGELGQWLLVAVRSVVANTSLRPTVLYCGSAKERLESYEAEGAEIRQVRSRLAPAIEARSRDCRFPPWTEGALLRYEIPSVFASDEWIIYADCDTVFLRDPQIDFRSIEVLGGVKASLAPECETYNSGVLVFNTKRFSAVEADLFAFLERTLGNWLPSSIDQSALNVHFGSRISPLDARLNWTAKFGFNDSVDIVHFHSVRFQHVEALLAGDFRGFERSLTLSGYIHEYARHVSSSLHTALRYLPLIRDFLRGTSFEAKVDRISAAVDSQALIANAMAAHAEVGAAGVQALSLAHAISDGEGRKSVKFRCDELEPRTVVQIHTCKNFGFGELTIRFDANWGEERIQLLHSPSIWADMKWLDPSNISCRWSGIGIDCHFILARVDGSPDIGPFTVECIGYGNIQLVVTVLEGAAFNRGPRS